MKLCFRRIFFAFLTGLSIISKVFGKCYFPGELQGVWATQAAPDVLDAPIGYSMVTINAHEISTWGQCYSKVDNNIILADRSGPRSAPCFRCFRLVIASVNVAVLVSGGLESCLSSVEDAVTLCPTTERGTSHIVLYKVRSSWGDSGLQEAQCPFSGIYFFSFEADEMNLKGVRRIDRERGSMICPQPTSEMSNCPFGFSFSLQYRDCTFEEPRTANWHCLGSWEGLDGQKYTAVLDTYAREGDGKPKYKCGMYKEDKKTGRVFLAFSQDSTCINSLESAENGHERYLLYRAPSSPLPTSVRERTCRFPSSLKGQWHNMEIGRSTITYRDERNFQTLHMQCVREYGDSERYAVYTRTDCGKWFYTCIYLKRRSANVMEMMFGDSSTESLHATVCNIERFGNMSVWITQARTNLEGPTSSCPVVGTYKGELPDAPGFCAQLYSDCTRTDLMYYAVDECNLPNRIYERKKFSHPRQVTAAPFASTKGVVNFQSGTGRDRPLIRRQPSTFEIPQEIQIGAINLLPPSGRIGVENSVYDTVSHGGPSLTFPARKKRSPPKSSASFNSDTPRTTAISFVWGRTSEKPTPSPPPVFLNISAQQLGSGVDWNRASQFNTRLDPTLQSDWMSNRRPRVRNQGNVDHVHRAASDSGFLNQNRNRFHDHISGTEFYGVPQASQRFPIINPGILRPPPVRIQPFPNNIPSLRPPPVRGSSIHSFRQSLNHFVPVSGTRSTLLPVQSHFSPSGFRPSSGQILNNNNPLGFWPSINKGPTLAPQANNNPLKFWPSSGTGQRINQQRKESVIDPNNPLGFWPSNNNRGSLQFSRNSSLGHFGHSGTTAIPGFRLSRDPLSPVPLLREISISTTPSPFGFPNTVKNNDIDTNRRAKWKPRHEEREYQCIGQWEENGRVYALTRRKDIHTLECFVGVINALGVVYIKEAGPSCRRDVRPDDFGMKTVMKEECVQESSRSRVRHQNSQSGDGWRGSRWISRSREATPTRPPWVPSTTRPWKPITGRPRRRSSGNSTFSGSRVLVVLNLLILYLAFASFKLIV